MLPLLLVGGIIVAATAWYARPRPVPVNINVVGVANGTTTLSLSPSTLTLEPNTEATLTLTLDSPTTHVAGAQIQIMYDANKIGTPTVTLGSFLSTTLAGVKVEGGIITFTVGASPDSGGITGSGVIATIKIKPPIAGNSSLTFGEANQVYVTEATTNMLKSANNATINVASNVPASAPASASPSPSPSPSPSAGNPQKPAKPTGLQSNCYDNGNKITLRWDAVSGANSYKLRLDQKDGNHDQSIDNIASTQYDLTIIPDQTYSWWVHTTKNGLDSEEAKIGEVLCHKTTASATPTPTSTPTATPKPTVKPTAKPSPTATDVGNGSFVEPSPLPSVSPIAYPNTSPTPSSTNKSIFEMIADFIRHLFGLN